MRTKETNTTVIISAATSAAQNAAAAALAAAEAAKTASENASTAAKAASDSATAIAVVATDTSWMKKTLVSIEETLNEMSKQFVTAAQHAEVCKSIQDHEDRLRSLEQRTWIWVGALLILSFLIPIFLKIFFKI